MPAKARVFAFLGLHFTRIQVHDTLHAEILVCRFRLAIERSRMATQRQRMSKTPNLDGLTGAFGNFTARVEAAAGAAMARMESVGGSAESSVANLNAAIDPIESTVRQINDVAAQLTNGGPPLAPSVAPPAPPVTLPPVTMDSAPATNPAPALPVAAMLHGVPVPDAASAHADAMRQAHAGPAEAKGPA